MKIIRLMTGMAGNQGVEVKGTEHLAGPPDGLE